MLARFPNSGLRAQPRPRYVPGLRPSMLIRVPMLALLYLQAEAKGAHPPIYQVFNQPIKGQSVLTALFIGRIEIHPTLHVQPFCVVHIINHVDTNVVCWRFSFTKNKFSPYNLIVCCTSQHCYPFIVLYVGIVLHKGFVHRGSSVLKNIGFEQTLLSNCLCLNP